MTLRLKMILGIGAILLVVILAYAGITARIQAGRLRDLARREAELIAAVTERAVGRAMTQGKSEQVQAILEEIGGLPPLVSLRIADPDGTILRSSYPAEIGRALSEPDAPTDASAPAGLRDAGSTVAVARAIPNRPACHGCHDPARPVLGIIHARLTVPSLEAQGTRQWAALVLPASLALMVAGGLIAAYFTLVIGRRIDTLSEAMRRTEAGHLSGSVPEDDRDELGRLGESFNVMVARLAEAQRQLEDRHAAAIRRAEHLAALGKVAAGIAHEINNPLAGMQNCVRTLLRGTRDERQRIQYLEMLGEGLGRVGGIVSQLLNFARENRPQLTRIELAPVVRRSLGLLEHEIQARDIACAVALEPGLPPLVADPGQLQQVFLNLLMNAIESMPRGGTVTVDAGVRREGPDRFAEVRITDTGVGIPPEHLARVFDPFFTTKDVGQGTGLGLSVSYGIVRAHGGFIDVASTVGQGTTFTVVLPVREEGEHDGPSGPPGGR